MAKIAGMEVLFRRPDLYEEMDILDALSLTDRVDSSDLYCIELHLVTSTAVVGRLALRPESPLRQRGGYHIGRPFVLVPGGEGAQNSIRFGDGSLVFVQDGYWSRVPPSDLETANRYARELADRSSESSEWIAAYDAAIAAWYEDWKFGLWMVGILVGILLVALGFIAHLLG